MANKSIQLSDGSNNLYPYIPPIVTDWSSSVSATIFARHTWNSIIWKPLKLGMLYFNQDANTANLPVGQWINLFTLPSGSRPSGQRYFVIPTQGNPSYGILLQIQSTGAVQIYYPLSTGAFIRGTIVFDLA